MGRVGKQSGQSGWKFALGGLAGGLFLRTLRASWRIRETPKRLVFTRRDARTEGAGTIYVVWHSRILLSVATQKGSRAHVLISQHGDGEYIARTAHHMGFETVRGSSTRGGARALIDIVKLLRAGKDVAFTPDGPRGPRCKVQPGCIVAAAKSGASIVPVGMNCGRKKRLRSWDRFMLPGLFTRVAVRFGEPYTLPKRMTEEETTAACQHLEAVLIDLDAQVAADLGVPPETPEIDPLGATRAEPSG